MSTKQGGSGKGHCDVCSRAYTWGCGHSGSQEYAARKHRLTAKHRMGACRCFSHRECDDKCKLKGPDPAGYMPFYQHRDIIVGLIIVDDNGGVAPEQPRRTVP